MSCSPWSAHRAWNAAISTGLRIGDVLAIGAQIAAINGRGKRSRLIMNDDRRANGRRSAYFLRTQNRRQTGMFDDDRLYFTNDAALLVLARARPSVNPRPLAK